MGHPIGIDSVRLHFVATYESDARRLEKLRWVDQQSGKAYSVTTADSNGARSTAPPEELSRRSQRVLVSRRVQMRGGRRDANGEPPSAAAFGDRADTVKFYGQIRIVDIEDRGLVDSGEAAARYLCLLLSVGGGRSDLHACDFSFVQQIIRINSITKHSHRGREQGEMKAILYRPLRSVARSRAAPRQKL